MELEQHSLIFLELRLQPKCPQVTQHRCGQLGPLNS